MGRPEPVALLFGVASLGAAMALAKDPPRIEIPPAIVAAVHIPGVPVTPLRPEGSLTGLTVYLSAGHGWVSHQKGRGWQRPETEGLIEDTWTATFVARHLVPALERAGAMVLTIRERDRNGVSVVVDDLDPGFTASGIRWQERAPQEAGTRDTLPTGSATLLDPDGSATWRFIAPSNGTWTVYTSWTAADDRDPDARYTVHLPNGSAVASSVDQRVHGGSWWPIGDYALHAGEAVEVRLSGSGDGLLSANAVRMGGGSQEVVDVRTGLHNWLPTWKVAAVHQLPGAGVPEWVWSGLGGGMGGDASVRARWADWAHPEGEEAVYLSVHSDGGGGRGSTAYVRHKCWGQVDCKDRTSRSEELADLLRTELIERVRNEIDPTWVDRGTRQAVLAEVSDELNPGMPSVLLEMGFHDNPEDAVHLGGPAFPDLAAEALVTGMIRWRGGDEAPLPPAPPSARWEDSVTWAAGDAHGWRVRTCDDGLTWSAPIWTTAPRFKPSGANVAIEIAGVGPGGIGTPVVLTRSQDALADAPLGQDDVTPD